MKDQELDEVLRERLRQRRREASCLEEVAETDVEWQVAGAAGALRPYECERHGRFYGWLGIEGNDRTGEMFCGPCLAEALKKPGLVPMKIF